MSDALFEWLAEDHRQAVSVTRVRSQQGREWVVFDMPDGVRLVLSQSQYREFCRRLVNAG